MFGTNTFLSPGQEVKSFRVLEPEKIEVKGRYKTNGVHELGTILAVIAETKPEERERWHQIGHAVSHKIITQGAPAFGIKENCLLEQNGRRFYIHGVNNPGGLGHVFIYYCEERGDIAWVSP